MNVRKKVLILGNSALVVFGFRGELIEKLIFEGYDVFTSFPSGPFGDGKKLSEKYKCKFIETEINRHGQSAREDLKLLKKYKKIICDIKPDVVLAYTVKCDIYGGIAAQKYNVPFIPNITGLGKGLKSNSLTSLVVRLLYKRALKKSNCIFFQNTSDLAYFNKYKLGSDNKKLLPGSGVNLSKFQPLAFPKDHVCRFTYIARIMKAKGIDEFLFAAQKMKELYHENVEFHICGYCEEEYSKILKEYSEKSIIVYHGLLDNVIPMEEQSNCIVLPSFHPEGVSNVLLEAAACGRPIITTDITGCKEVVDNNVNGYVIPPKDGQVLFERMNSFFKLSLEEQEQMGKLGRIKVEEHFDRNIVVSAYMSELNTIFEDKKDKNEVYN